MPGAGGSVKKKLARETLVADVQEGSVRRYALNREGFGVRRARVESVRVGVAAENGALICRIFFFQAEDGIRDLYVTGVQTCALPIFEVSRTARTEPAPGRENIKPAR